MIPALPTHDTSQPPDGHSMADPEPLPAPRRRARGRDAVSARKVDPAVESWESARRRAGVDEWRRRRLLERQLHDGASLRVSALALRLGLLRERPPGDAADWRERIDELQDELHAVLQELRDVSSKIYPPLLDQAGLSAALRELTDQAGLEVILEVPAGARFGPAAEGAAYFAVASCLAARPSDAPGVARISVIRQAGRGRGDQDDLVLRVDGVTARDLGPILDQVRPLGGTAELVGDDPAGTGTITVRIPCE